MTTFFIKRIRIVALSWVISCTTIGNLYATESQDCVEVNFEDGPKVMLNKSKVEKFNAVLEWPSERITGAWILPPKNIVGADNTEINSILLGPRTNFASALNKCETLSDGRTRCNQEVPRTELAYSVIFKGKPSNRTNMLDQISIHIQEEVLTCDNKLN
jgi:hypothetical protein